MRPRSARLTQELVLLAVTAALLGTIVILAGPARLDSVLQALVHGHLSLARARLQAMGDWQVLAVITLVLAHTVLPFPIELVAAAAGFSLGLAVALPVLLGSLVLSALITYIIGLRLGRPAVAAFIGPHRLGRVEQLVARGGARALLLVRLIPLVPFSPVGLVCGVSRVPVTRFLWTSALGILPELTLVTLLGQRLRSPQLNDPVLWLPLVGILLLVLGTLPLLRRLWPTP